MLHLEFLNAPVALSHAHSAPLFRPCDSGWRCKASLPGVSAKDASVEVSDGAEKLLWIKTPQLSKKYR